MSSSTYQINTTTQYNRQYNLNSNYLLITYTAKCRHNEFWELLGTFIFSLDIDDVGSGGGAFRALITAC